MVCAQVLDNIKANNKEEVGREKDARAAADAKLADAMNEIEEVGACFPHAFANKLATQQAPRWPLPAAEAEAGSSRRGARGPVSAPAVHGAKARPGEGEMFKWACVPDCALSRLTCIAFRLQAALEQRKQALQQAS